MRAPACVCVRVHARACVCERLYVYACVCVCDTECVCMFER